MRPSPGVKFKQFTARDVVSRWDVIQAHRRATAQAATDDLHVLSLGKPGTLGWQFGANSHTISACIA